MKVSLKGLYRLIQLKTGDLTYLEPDLIPDPEERQYTMQLLMHLCTHLRSASDVMRIADLLEEWCKSQPLSALEALERLAMLS
jgi:hypothetical protein